MLKDRMNSMLSDDDLDLVVGGVGSGGGKASISSDCIECGTCLQECPTGAISQDYHVDQDACVGCGACVGCCPSGAIKMQ